MKVNEHYNVFTSPVICEFTRTKRNGEPDGGKYRFWMNHVTFTCMRHISERYEDGFESVTKYRYDVLVHDEFGKYVDETDICETDQQKAVDLALKYAEAYEQGLE